MLPGILLGGGLGLALEFATVRARLRARNSGGSPLAALVGGFLARLALLLGGTLAGAFGAPWAPVPFLLSCAAALLLGEALAFLLLRRPRRRSDSTPPQ